MWILRQVLDLLVQGIYMCAFMFLPACLLVFIIIQVPIYWRIKRERAQTKVGGGKVLLIIVFVCSIHWSVALVFASMYRVDSQLHIIMLSLFYRIYTSCRDIDETVTEKLTCNTKKDKFKLNYCTAGITDQ